MPKLGIVGCRSATESTIVAIGFTIETNLQDITDMVEEDKGRGCPTFGLVAGSELRGRHELAFAFNDWTVVGHTTCSREDLQRKKEKFSNYLAFNFFFKQQIIITLTPFPLRETLQRVGALMALGRRSPEMPFNLPLDNLALNSGE
jgi:hypothetical protein